MRGWLLGWVVAAFGLGTLALSAIAPASALAACNLGNGVQHVVVLQFDNVHSERDNPNVPSDLEQMPALRNFLTSNGTLLTNDHTILISHTVNGIVSTETGLYPDRNGVTVGNSYFGWGQGKVSSRITLHHRVRLHGRYLLTVTVVGGPRTKTHVRL